MLNHVKFNISEEDKLKDLLEIEYLQPAPEVWLMLVHPQMIIAEEMQQCELGKK